MNHLKPIFITGVYRSGTTLFSRILNNHSKLQITYDNVHFMRFCYDKFNPVEDVANYSALIDNVKKRVEARMETKWDTSQLISLLKKVDKIDYSIVYNEIMKSLFPLDENCQWGEKTMICWTKIPLFLNMFPHGKVFHILRDPRDVLSSFKRVTNEPGIRYFDAIFTTLHSMEWAYTEGRKLNQKNYFVIRYEDLVAMPDETVKKICTFLEIDFENAMLDHSKFVDRAGKGWDANTAYGEKKHGVESSSVGKFSEKLSNIEIFFSELIGRNMMEKFGYDLTGTWLSEDEWDEFYAILSDKFVSKRFRNWLKTNKGVEDYPSPPPEVLREKGLENI